MKVKKWFVENKWLLLIMTLAAALRLYHLDFQSLWLDEILSMNDANPKLTWMEFYDGIMFWEFIPHFYFALLRICFEIFGFSSFVARFFTAIIGIVGVYSIYLLVNEILDKKAGLLASLLLAVNVFHISYSQEVRPYGLLLLFTTLAFYRLVLLVKKSSIKNAIYFGLTAGFIIHSHFFGFITIFAQYLILLFFIIITPKEERFSFFKVVFISGLVFLVTIIPAIDPIVRVSEINSFWLQKPTSDSFSILLKDFYGNSEWILFVIQFILIYYVINLFQEKNFKIGKENILNNKNIFSFILLFGWVLISLVIPLLRSYLDVPMILSRYFINVLPATIIILVIGIWQIRNKLIQVIIVSAFVIFSLIDLLVVKNYYKTVTKSQYRELSLDIVSKNKDNDKIVVFWSWIFPHYLQNMSDAVIEGNSLNDYVNGMKNGSIKLESFWFADANSRTINLTEDEKLYLSDHFIVIRELNYYDAWAIHYQLKPEFVEKEVEDTLSLAAFKNVSYDSAGNMMFFTNGSYKSTQVTLNPGVYKLSISANSLPAVPIRGENARLQVRMKGKTIAELILSEKLDNKENIIEFTVHKKEKTNFQLTFINDFADDRVDRNIVVYNVNLVKI